MLLRDGYVQVGWQKKRLDQNKRVGLEVGSGFYRACVNSPTAKLYGCSKLSTWPLEKYSGSSVTFQSGGKG